MIEKQAMVFLQKLSKNNNREWFAKNKHLYTQAHANIIAFADSLLEEMNTHDLLETSSGKKSLYRIYKDVRFSKEKTPYNIYWSGGFKRATKKLRGGYYFHIEPGNTFLAGGFFGPNPGDLQKIRQDMELNHKKWKKLFSKKDFIQTFGKMQGSQLATAPRGYDKNHPAIDLLRYKQFILKYKFTDKEVYNPDFAYTMSEKFKRMRPFLNYMSEVLTTDANGQSLID